MTERENEREKERITSASFREVLWGLCDLLVLLAILLNGLMQYWMAINEKESIRIKSSQWIEFGKKENNQSFDFVNKSEQKESRTSSRDLSRLRNPGELTSSVSRVLASDTTSIGGWFKRKEIERNSKVIRIQNDFFSSYKWLEILRHFFNDKINVNGSKVISRIFSCEIMKRIALLSIHTRAQ